MPKVTSWITVIRLFEKGKSMTEVAKVFGCSRAHISAGVRQYYTEFPTYRNIYLNMTCTVCGIEEESLLKTVSVLKDNNVKFGNEVKKITFICPLCSSNKLYLCTTCGAMSQESEIPKFSRKQKLQHGVCRTCQNERMKIWVKNNPERWKEIQEKNLSTKKGCYQETASKRYKENRKRGLCVNCGTPTKSELTTCEKCNNRRNEYQKKRRDSRRAKGLCIKCGKRPSVPPILHCEECRKSWA